VHALLTCTHCASEMVTAHTPSLPRCSHTTFGVCQSGGLFLAATSADARQYYAHGGGVCIRRDEGGRWRQWDHLPARLSGPGGPAAQTTTDPQAA
jgi:hypothetical protein